MGDRTREGRAMMTGHNSRGKVFDDRILYTPSPFARASLLYLQEVGRLTALIPHTRQREKLQSCLCFAVLEGRGNSLNTYLQQVRITHAKQMLRFTDEKIEGMACGVGELSYFSRIFKKVEVISQKEYQRMW